MFRRLRSWRSAAFPLRPSPELSRVVVGSTGSGKSVGEMVELLRLAERGDHAVVLLDGHGPLAVATVGHWVVRGHESRIVYEPLDAVDRVLAWPMLPRSRSLDPTRRLLEDTETRDEIVQCLLAQRNIATLTDRPWTREWIEAAVALSLFQPRPEPLSALVSAFHPRTAEYERLMRHCEQPDVAEKFRDLERIRRKSDVHYETLTGAARRMLEAVCCSPVVRLRSRPGPFDWLAALKEQRLLAFDGGNLRSRELKRTLFLFISMNVIQAVRRSFADTRRPLPVVLVLEEAGALGLLTPFVSGAMQELRKAGLAAHLLTQSCRDFGDLALFESILGNAPIQSWYQVLAPADQELGGRVLTNATFDSRAVHFTRTRFFRGDEGSSPRAVEITDAYYKSPQLVEQEYRTALATLRIGERFVRDRTGVRREQVRMLRPPRVPGGFEAYTAAAIRRIRAQPIYLPPLPVKSPASTDEQLDAAARLRAQVQ